VSCFGKASTWIRFWDLKRVTPKRVASTQMTPKKHGQGQAKGIYF